MGQATPTLSPGVQVPGGPFVLDSSGNSNSLNPLVLPANSYSASLPPRSLAIGSDGDQIFVDGFGQPVFRGDKLWNWNVKSTANKSLFITQTSETNVVDDFLSVNNIGRNGLRPIIKAGRLLKMGSFRVRLRGGIQLGGSVSNTLNIGIYAKESTSVKTSISAYAIPFTSMGANASNALDIEVESWIEHCGDATETTSCNIRGHSDVRIGLNNAISAGSFEGLAETYASTLNLSIDQTIKVTAWWANSGATLYVDGIDIWDA